MSGTKLYDLGLSYHKKPVQSKRQYAYLTKFEI